MLAMRGNRHFRLTSITPLQIYKLWQNADDVSDHKIRLWQIRVPGTWINNTNKHQYKDHQKGLTSSTPSKKFVQ